MFTSRKEIYVGWGHCDPNGIVFYPRYLEYGAYCTNELFEKAGLSKPQMLKNYGLAGIPMVELRARILAPCQFGDRIVAESYVSEWGNTSFSVHHRMWKESALVAEIFEKQVWVAREEGEAARFKGKAIPQEVKDLFAGSTPDDRN